MAVAAFESGGCNQLHRNRLMPTVANTALKANSRPTVETLPVINRAFPHWFCGSFKAFNDAPARLPFDQHELVGAERIAAAQDPDDVLAGDLADRTERDRESDPRLRVERDGSGDLLAQARARLRAACPVDERSRQIHDVLSGRRDQLVRDPGRHGHHRDRLGLERREV